MTIDLNRAAPLDEPRRDRIKVADIKPRLNDDVASFLSWLFEGRALIRNGKGCIGNISGDKGLSLEIELRGASAGLWYDFNTEEGGDLIQLYRSWRGYTGIAHFQLSLQEIAKDYLGDPIEFKRPNWQPTPFEKIASDKKKFGNKPADDEPLSAPIASYQYKNADGSINTIVTRHEPKTFRPRCFKMIDGEMKWAPGMPEIRPLYHLPEVTTASEVVLVEGEGKADLLADALGIVVTSIMGGSNERAVEKADLAPLAGKTIKVWPDNDAPGLKYADHIAGKLSAIGAKVLMVPIPPGKPEKWDCADCIKEGGDPAAILASAVELNASPAPKPPPATPVWREQRANGWPIASMHNARVAIMAVEVECSYDTFHNRMLFGYADDATRHFVEPILGEVSDNGILCLRRLLSDYFGFDLTEKHVRDAVVSLALEHCFNPVADMLDQAEANWDGVGRLDRVAADYFNCEDTPLNAACFRKTMIAGVARVRDPGCKFDTILTLEGSEGINKSTAIRWLAVDDDNFSDEKIIGKDSREVQEQLAGVGSMRTPNSPA